MTSPGLAVLHDMLSSQGDVRDLTHQQVPALRAIFEDTTGAGLWLFAVFICGCKDLSFDLHYEECQFLSRWGRLVLADGTEVVRPQTDEDEVVENWRRLMLCVPRDTLKSSLGTRATTLWYATLDPTITIGIFNEAQDNPKKWIGAIKQVVEGSRLYHQLWPDRLPPGIHYKERERGVSVPRSWKWGDSGMALRRDTYNVAELTFEPFGVGSAHVGKHFTHKVYDDIVGLASLDSPAVMQAAVDFMDHGRAIERPSDRGCELMVFTRWHYNDVYQYALNKWPNEYRVYHRSLLEHPETGEPDVVEGVSIWPERFPTRKARTMYEEDPFTFMSQRQCIPMSGRETSFPPEWVRGITMERTVSDEPVICIRPQDYDPHRVAGAVHGERAPNLVPLSWCDKAILLDPAPSKKGEKTAEPRARNGLVVVAKDPWGRVFTLQSVPLREDPVTVMEAIVLLAVYWRLHKVGIEEVNFSAVYNPLWTALLRHRHPRLELSFIPLLPKGEDKETRIRKLVGPHREGLWYYNIDRCGYVLQELLEYPNCETRDLLDAEAYEDQVLNRPTTPDEQAVMHTLSRTAAATRCPHTGY